MLTRLIISCAAALKVAKDSMFTVHVTSISSGFMMSRIQADYNVAHVAEKKAWEAAREAERR